jgi:hypothetical protein
MTNQIETMMALADDYADWAEAKGKGHPTYAESREALQSALEAALKPEEPVYWEYKHVDDGEGDWQRLIPRVGQTLETALKEIQGYRSVLRKGSMYEVRPIYTTPPTQTYIREMLIQAASMAVVLERRGEYQSATRVADAVLKCEGPPAQTPVEYCQSCGDVATRHLPEEATAFPGSYCDQCGQDTTPPAQTPPQVVWDFGKSDQTASFDAVVTAQTPAPPPRLTEDQVWKLWNEQGDDEMNQVAACDFARAIETAVRRQFGVNDE